MRLVLIEWEDAFNGDHKWTEIADIPKRISPMVIQTVGFVVRRSKKRVTLTMSVARNKTCCDMFTIPTAMIRKEVAL